MATAGTTIRWPWTILDLNSQPLTGMTAEKLDAILAQQMPDEEKRRRADFVVDTSQSFDTARAQVRAVLAAVATMPRRRK